MRKLKLSGKRAEIFLSIFEYDEELYKIAKLRFVDGVSVEDIAKQMYLSERHVYRLTLDICYEAIGRLTGIASVKG
jgi:hypothetical protein